ncbi:MAG: hypothetical protein WCG34_06390 [Leptolinea sp.]
MKNLYSTLFATVVLSLGLAACSGQQVSGPTFASIPAGRAYSEGKEIFFSHTEVSDPAVADKLSAMMKSPVLLVPSLAKVPDELTAPVYVFENGIAGKGPLGFQPDVFSNPPGTDGYTPLRKIMFVKWAAGVAARELKAAGEILEAEKKGELSLQKSDVVVNMPFMVWDNGKR